MCPKYLYNCAITRPSQGHALLSPICKPGGECNSTIPPRKGDRFSLSLSSCHLSCCSETHIASWRQAGECEPCQDYSQAATRCSAECVVRDLLRRQDETKLLQDAGAGNDPNCPANVELISQKLTKSRKVNKNQMSVGDRAATFVLSALLSISLDMLDLARLSPVQPQLDILA